MRWKWNVELVARHQVEHPQHRGLGLEVARDVEHEAAVAEARGVHDPQGRQRDALPRGRGRQQAAQGLQAVEDAGRRVAEDPDPGRRVDHELVRLGRVLPVDLPRLEAERDPPGLAFAETLGKKGRRESVRSAASVCSSGAAAIAGGMARLNRLSLLSSDPLLLKEGWPGLLILKCLQYFFPGRGG